MAICLICLSRDCHHLAPHSPRLNRGEARVLLALADGLSNKAIGFRVGLSTGTVKAYLSRLYSVLEVANRLQCGYWARDHRELLKEPADG
jgi:DNA-binding NarL/FixJ family response regulator